jgi:hypothetical protein
MILFAVLNFVRSIACSFVQVHLFWLSQYYGYLKKCLNENHGRKQLLDPLEEYFMYWFRLRHSIPEKVLAALFYVSTGSVNAIVKTWCILINSVCHPQKNIHSIVIKISIHL